MVKSPVFSLDFRELWYALFCSKRRETTTSDQQIHEQSVRDLTHLLSVVLPVELKPMNKSQGEIDYNLVNGRIL